MKNAAWREKREMREEMAYNGTMTMIRTTILFTPSFEHAVSSRIQRGVPLKDRLPIVFEVEIDRSG